MAHPAENAPPAAGWRLVRSYLWALAPLALGVPAGPCFAWAARRRRSGMLWVAAVLYAIATVVFFALAGSDDQWASDVGGGIGFALMAVATTHAFVIRRRVFDVFDEPPTLEYVPQPLEREPAFPALGDRPAETRDPSTWRTPFVCTGHDRHDLGLPLIRLAGFVFTGAAMTGIAWYFHASARAYTYGVGLLLVPLLVVAFRQRLAGPVVEYRWWGLAKSVRLDEATSVSTTRGGTLVLHAPDGRAVRIAVQAPGFTAPMDVRDHLRGWLTRPGVGITVEAAALLRGDAHVPAVTKRWGHLRRSLTVLGVVVSLVATGAALWFTYQEREARKIPGAPGYRTFGGPRGHALPIGRPWGRACLPVRFTVEEHVPDWVYAEVNRVVEEARRGGINVTLETRTFYWTPSSLYYPSGTTADDVPRVGIFLDDTNRRKGNRLERIELGWDAAADGSRHERLVDAQGVLHLPAIKGRLAEVRGAARVLIALTQGILDVTERDSGLRRASGIDRFTGADLAAMKRMSGCGEAAAPVVIYEGAGRVKAW